MASKEGLLSEAVRNLNVLELLDCNSALRKLSAVQKRHLESLAEGPLYFRPGERLWRAGALLIRRLWWCLVQPHLFPGGGMQDLSVYLNHLGHHQYCEVTRIQQIAIPTTCQNFPLV
jgi:hypothetical protein